MSTCISRHGEYSEHELDADHVCRRCAVLDEDALTAELNRLRAERDQFDAWANQLRYERRILGYSRMILDRMAEYENLTQFDQGILRGEAAKAAQRIVDEIGHPVTDEEALGPEFREEIKRLRAELASVTAQRDSARDAHDAGKRYIAATQRIVDAAKAYSQVSDALEHFKGSTEELGALADAHSLARYAVRAAVDALAGQTSTRVGTSGAGSNESGRSVASDESQSDGQLTGAQREVIVKARTWWASIEDGQPHADEQDALIEALDRLAAQPEDESRCHRCGGPNFVWSAPSPLWNQVMRRGDINGTEHWSGIICPVCFATLAEDLGIAEFWRISADRVHCELQVVTPSGRVWNDKTSLWQPWDEVHRPTAYLPIGSPHSEVCLVCDEPWPCPEAPSPQTLALVPMGRAAELAAAGAGQAGEEVASS